MISATLEAKSCNTHSQFALCLYCPDPHSQANAVGGLEWRWRNGAVVHRVAAETAQERAKYGGAHDQQSVD